MKIENLREFTDKFSVKTIESAILASSETNKTLSTYCCDKNKTLFVSVKMLDCPSFGNNEFAIGNVDDFIKKIDSLSYDKDITVTINKNKSDRVTSISLFEGPNKKDWNVTYVTCDPLVVTKPPEIKNINYDVEIKFDSEFIKRYLEIKSKFKESETVTFLNDKEGDLILKFGHSDLNTSRSSVKVDVISDNHTLQGPMSFSSENLMNILSSNKEIKELIFQIHTVSYPKGLARIKIDTEKFNCIYYLSIKT